MLSFDRYQFVESRLNMLTLKYIEKCMYVTVVLSPEEEDKIQSGGTALVEISRSKKSYVQEWITSDIEAYGFEDYSNHMRRKFESGDSGAIFEFCRNSEWAFRAWWVVGQIEKWLVERTDESLSHLRRLFDEYTGARGKSWRAEMTDLLIRDQKIFNRINAIVETGRKTAAGLRETARDFCLGYEVTREAYYKFTKRHKQLRMREGDFRGVAIGYPKPMPRVEDIDPILEELFGLQTMIRRIREERMLYQAMRCRLCDVEYDPDWPLKRVKDPTTIRCKLDTVFDEFAAQYWKDRTGLREMYEDYVKWEILRNHDAADVAQGLTARTAERSE